MNTTLLLMAVLVIPAIWSLAVWRLITGYWPENSPPPVSRSLSKSSETSLSDYQI